VEAESCRFERDLGREEKGSGSIELNGVRWFCRRTIIIRKSLGCEQGEGRF